MWQSKYKCFVIKKRYVCTKDKDLAKVYSLVKNASTYCDIDNTFGTLLEEIIDSLAGFAQNRRLLSEKLYGEVRKTLTLAYDTYMLFDAECETARDILMDSICDFQKLEELADKRCPLVDAKDKTEGYDAKANYREFRIRATHVTQDMSVSNTYNADYYVDIDPSNKKEESVSLPSLDGGCIKMTAVTKDDVTLKWNNKEFCVKFGASVSTENIFLDNPYLSSDSLRLTFTYRELPNYAELWSMIASLGCDELEEKEERYILTERKEEILHFIDKAIERGNTGLYVAKALLTIYNSWGTCKIRSIECFQNKLLQGINYGCLAPDNYFGWEWMKVAARYNDPSNFLEDEDLLREVLNTAAELGVVEAIDIVNSI